MKGKIITIGSSAGVTIPKAFRDELSLNAGTPVSIKMEDGAIVIRSIEAKPTEEKLHEFLKTVISVLPKLDEADTSEEGLRLLKAGLVEALSGVTDTAKIAATSKKLATNNII